MTAPTIFGTVANQTTSLDAPLEPFSWVTIEDTNAGATDTLTITLSGFGGTLAGTGLSDGTGGYTLAGSAATITSELRALTFTPNAAWPNPSESTAFTLSDISSASGAPTVDSTTTVTDSELNTFAATAAYVSANIDGINADANVSSIILTDSGVPTLHLTPAQAANDTTALGKIADSQYEEIVGNPGQPAIMTVGHGGAISVAFGNLQGTMASLYNSYYPDTVTGSNGTIGLHNAQTSVVGGSDTVWFDTSSFDAASLFNTGGAYDAVYGSNGSVGLHNAQTSVVGGGVEVWLDGSSNDAASLFNTGGAYDAVYGSNGSIGLHNAQAAVSGGNDTVYLDSNSGNAVSFFNTGNAWDGVFGSNGSVGLTFALAALIGNNDSFYFAAAHDSNVLSVSGNSETLVFQSVFGQDTIAGFVSSDALQFSASDFTNFQALQGHMAQSGANVTITFDASDNVTLLNTQLPSLTASQFRFV